MATTDQYRRTQARGYDTTSSVELGIILSFFFLFLFYNRGEYKPANLRLFIFSCKKEYLFARGVSLLDDTNLLQPY